MVTKYHTGMGIVISILFFVILFLVFTGNAAQEQNNENIMPEKTGSGGNNDSAGSNDTENPSVQSVTVPQNTSRQSITIEP